MSDIDRDELRRLLDEATPGPWKAEGSQVRGPDRVLVAAAREHSTTVDRPDALIIAAAVNALPALLDAAAERDALCTWQERVALAAGIADEVAGYGVYLEADPDTAAEHVAGLLSIADTHVECPTYCGDCGESLADMPCDHCGGSGCGLGVGSGAQTDTDPGPDWRTQAACLGHDPETFFPHPTDHDGEDAAIAICSGCPVKADCLADAMKSENSRPTSRRHGIWGGKTPQHRYAMHRKEARRRGRKSA